MAELITIGNVLNFIVEDADAAWLEAIREACVHRKELISLSNKEKALGLLKNTSIKKIEDCLCDFCDD